MMVLGIVPNNGLREKQLTLTTDKMISQFQCYFDICVLASDKSLDQLSSLTVVVYSNKCIFYVYLCHNI